MFDWSTPALEGVCVLGTYGGRALANGFANKVHYVIHLTSFNYFRRNIKQQLQDRGLPTSAVVEIIDDVMGCQKHSEGLINCESQDEFH